MARVIYNWKYKHLRGQRQFVKLLDYLLKKEMGCKPQPYVVFAACKPAIRTYNYDAFVKDRLMTADQAKECQEFEAAGGTVYIKYASPNYHSLLSVKDHSSMRLLKPMIEEITFTSPVFGR